MSTLNKHWTERSAGDFLYRIGLDFVSSLESSMGDMTQAEFAKVVGKSEGRISQIFNNPGNLTLKTAIEYARGLGLKIAIVTYNDGDPDNNNGPINSEIFSKCWERLNKPTDFFELTDACKLRARTDSAGKMIIRVYTARATSTEHGPYAFVRSGISSRELAVQSQ